MKLPYFSIPLLAIVGLLSLLAGCGGGSSSDSAQDIGLRNVGLDSANFGCDGDCPNQSLSVAEVQQVIQESINPEMFRSKYADVANEPRWNAIQVENHLRNISLIPKI